MTQPKSRRRPPFLHALAWFIPGLLAVAVAGLVTHPLTLVPLLLANALTMAAICHAIWSLVEADSVRGRTLTSWPSLQTDVRNAGGTWVDQEVVVDGNANDPDVQAAAEQLRELTAQDGDFAASAISTAPDGDLLLIEVALTGESRIHPDRVGGAAVGHLGDLVAGRTGADEGPSGVP